jgi:two-component sensor histidine kinase/putative methionine-R-sulfoxide reductase with GAF domain
MIRKKFQRLTGLKLGFTPEHLLRVFVLLGLFYSLNFLSRNHYLLFHCLAEVFSIVIACGIFMISWNGKKMLPNCYLLYIGIAYLFVGGIDFLHVITYKGMGVLNENNGSNLPTQLWIISRYIEAFSLMAATYFFNRKLYSVPTLLAYAMITGLILCMVFYWKTFPDCYIEGTGLTLFKIYSEYIICLIFLAAIGFLIKNKKSFDRVVLYLLVASIAVKILQEVSFTRYLSVYGFSNFFGHFLKIISFYLLYRALIWTSLVSPWNMLFHERIKIEDALKSSNERLKLLAAVAERLFRAEDPQKDVEHICNLVMKYLDCQFFFNYLVTIPGQQMILNTNAGIPEEEAEKIRYLDFGVAVCGCVARDGERMIQENIQCSFDPRVKLVKSFGVQAYCCHPLMAHGNLIGTLSFGTSTRQIFTPDEISLMKQVADQVAVAMERLRINMVLLKNEENLKNSLNEKEALLKEIHHRVKNNMQVISSLVSLQAVQSQNPIVQEELRDVSNRVRSMAMVHEKLYQATDLSRIDFDQYIDSLLRHLWHSYGNQSSGVNLIKNLEPVLLPVDKAIPLGLILNELVNNALKHAYPDTHKGEVAVTLKKDKEKGLILIVRDYGKGLPPDLDWEKTESLGLRLLQMLSSQLSAVVEVKINNGSEFRVILGGIQF